MTYLFFIASFNAFFFLALLLQKRPKLLHDRILIFWLFYLGFATAIYAFTIDFFPENHLLSTGVISLLLLQGPFLYLYVTALTLNKKNFNYKNIWHFSPFIAFVLYLLIAFNFPSYAGDIRIEHLSEGGVEPPFLFVFFLIVTAVSGPVYFFLAFMKFQKSKTSSLDFSSKKVNIDWLEKLIPIFGSLWTILIVIAGIHHVFHLFSMTFCTNGLFLSLSAFIILIGYYGIKQNEVFVSNSAEVENSISIDSEIKYAATRMEGDELQQCCDKVGRYMKVEKPYLDSDLTLPKLAQGLNVSTHHLSQVINEKHGMNFFNFINEYRVDEVKRKIKDPKYKNYSLLGIAFESGFNSKSAFNRVFKDLTGTTPSGYRDSLPTS